MTKTVLISGAGIAGLTTAYWLHHHGFTPTVVERAPGIRAGGYKVDVRGAALTVAERMGVLDAIRARKTDIRAGTVVDARGRHVAAMDGDTFGGRAHGDAELLRGDLAELLYDRTKDTVEYLFSASIADLQDGDDGVKVTFTGGQVRRFDLVIGADGIHSKTRELAFGPGERYVHDLGYRVAVYSTPNDLGLDREELTYVGPGRTALTYSTAGDTGAKAMFLFASTTDARDTAAQQRVLAESYAGEGPMVQKLLAALPDAPDFYFDSLSQVHLDTWSRGRVCLVGDAAYAASAASGQGTSLALVGGYVLAGELARGDQPGFAAYENAMREFVTHNQNLGPANVKRMVLRGTTQVRLSMAMLRLVNRLPGKDKLMAKVVEPIQRAATAITLQDY